MRNFLCFKILFSLFHFLNCAGSGPEWSLNRCQDMASVVGSLINAGCQFNKPDHVNRGFEPKIFMSSDKIEDDRVIKARGLPWQASDHDIARWVNPSILFILPPPFPSPFLTRFPRAVVHFPGPSHGINKRMIK